MPQSVHIPQNETEVALQRIIPSAGVPDSDTGAGFAQVGQLCIDYVNADLYVNAGTTATPDWQLVTRASV